MLFGTANDTVGVQGNIGLYDDELGLCVQSIYKAKSAAKWSDLVGRPNSLATPFYSGVCRDLTMQRSR